MKVMRHRVVKHRVVKHMPMKIAVTALAASALATGALAQQQTAPVPQPAPPSIYMPFVWQGNALDQKILDAQAQALPEGPRQRVPHRRRHR